MSVDKKLKNTLYDKEERYKWKGVPVMDNSIEIKKLNKQQKMEGKCISKNNMEQVL